MSGIEANSDEFVRDWSRDTAELVAYVLHFEEAYTYDRDPQRNISEIERTVASDATLGLWTLSYMASREVAASRIAAARLSLAYGYSHGLLPTGVLITLLRDPDENVTTEAWISLHRLYEDPRDISAAAAEIDALIEALSSQ
jgi:hypothetical protein